MSWHDKVQTGDIVQRCTSDVDTVRLFYREQVIQIAQTVRASRSDFRSCFWLDWKMALCATALMPVIILFAMIFFRKVQGSFKKTDEAEGIMTAALQENLTGIRVVRAFARQEFEIERFTKKNADYRDRHWRLFIIMAIYWSTSDLMCMTQFAAIVFVGAWRASRGNDDDRHDDRVRLVCADVHLADPRSRPGVDRAGKNAGFDHPHQGSAGCP